MEGARRANGQGQTTKKLLKYKPRGYRIRGRPLHHWIDNGAKAEPLQQMMMMIYLQKLYDAAK